METLTLEDLYVEQEKISAGKRQLEMNLAGHEGALQAIDNLIAMAGGGGKRTDAEGKKKEKVVEFVSEGEIT